MSEDGTKDEEGVRSFRTRRRTRRAKRRPLRVPVDEVPRRSVVEMSVSEEAPPRKSSFPPPKPAEDVDVDVDDDEEPAPEAKAHGDAEPEVESEPVSPGAAERSEPPKSEPPKSDSGGVVVRGSVTITDHPSSLPREAEAAAEVEIPKAPRIPSTAPEAGQEGQNVGEDQEAAEPAAGERVLAQTIEEQIDPSVPADADDGWLEESSTEITIEAADPDDEELADVEVEIEAAEEADGEHAADGESVEAADSLELEEEPERSVSEVTEELDLSAISEVAEEADADDLGIEEELGADEIEDAGPPPAPAEAKKQGNSAPPPPPAAKAEKATPPSPPQNEKKPSEGKAPPPPPDEKAAAAAVAASQKRRRPWFETFFNDDYLRTVPAYPYKHVSRQCDFIQEILKLPAGSTVLDVGCGLGLHALELRARGYLVVGLDLSLPMLSRAADEAQDRGVKINFLHSDMREMTFEGAFDAILCWGTTFGYFDDDSNKKVLARLYQALKPRGLLLMDIVNRDFVVRQQPNLVWFEGDGCVCMEETQFNFIKDRLEVKRTVILDDGRQRETYYSVRLYTLHEIGQLMHHQGFRVASISGQEATPNVFFGADSPRMIILAERRAKKGEKKAKAKADAKPKPPPAPDGAEDADDAEELALEDVEVEEEIPPPPEEKTKPEAKALREAEGEAEDGTDDASAEALEDRATDPGAEDAPAGAPPPGPDDYVEEGDTIVGAEIPVDDEEPARPEDGEAEEGDAAGVTDPDAEDDD